MKARTAQTIQSIVIQFLLGGNVVLGEFYGVAASENFVIGVVWLVTALALLVYVATDRVSEYLEVRQLDRFTIVPRKNKVAAILYLPLLAAGWYITCAAWLVAQNTMVVMRKARKEYEHDHARQLAQEYAARYRSEEFGLDEPDGEEDDADLERGSAGLADSVESLLESAKSKPKPQLPGELHAVSAQRNRRITIRRRC